MMMRCQSRADPRKLKRKEPWESEVVTQGNEYNWHLSVAIIMPLRKWLFYLWVHEGKLYAKLINKYAPFSSLANIANTDGSVSRSKSKAAIDGAMRGPSGGWLVGFRMTTSIFDIFNVKAQVVLENRKLAWD
ncbi:hypothetical protein Gotur_030143 [Gossypium turneri]